MAETFNLFGSLPPSNLPFSVCRAQISRPTAPRITLDEKLLKLAPLLGV